MQKYTKIWSLKINTSRAPSNTGRFQAVAQRFECSDGCHQNLIHCNHFSTLKKDPKKLKINQPPPFGGKFDWVGPPDPVSNIRPIQFHIPLNETQTEKLFRLKRSEVLQWNQNFWAHHNSTFFREKEEYILRHQTINEDGKTSISPEVLSVFYKKFLDENRKAHLNYNREWYRQNIYLLWPAVKVALIRLKRKFNKQ